jgi:hypothetical protein
MSPTTLFSSTQNLVIPDDCNVTPQTENLTLRRMHSIRIQCHFIITADGPEQFRIFFHAKPPLSL